jgi:hypothetical protein
VVAEGTSRFLEESDLSAVELLTDVTDNEVRRMRRKRSEGGGRH